MRAALVVVLVFACGAVLVGCGSGHSVRLVGDTIEIGKNVSEASLVRSVLGIKVGTEASVVRSRLGKPFAQVGARRQTCWAYHARQPESSVSAIDFCVGPNRRVERILIGIHG